MTGKIRVLLIPVAILATIPVFHADVCRASPFGLRLSYTDDTPTGMTVTWNTTSDTASEVRYGTSPGNYTYLETGAAVPLPGALGYVHEVSLVGLAPDTAYYYIAGNNGDGFSPEYTFVTRPDPNQRCGSLSFIFMADNRPDPTFGGGENWAQILGQATGHRPSFILNGGDLVTDGDNYDGWVDFLNWTEPASAKIPFMPCLGNHDNGPGEGDGATYNRLFALPRSAGSAGSGTEDYYYFTFGNAIFAVLSTETFRGGATPLGTQAAWLDEVLTQNPRKWKFVMFHKPVYTKEVFFSISHPPNQEGQNAALIPIIDAHHVDVVFTSHNHWYERFEPSACALQGNPGSDQPCSVGADNYAAGTVYVISGGAGAFTIPGFLCGSQSGRVFCSGDHHYLVLTIDNETLTLQTWGAFPQNNQVFDGITIIKPAENCSDLCPDDPNKDKPGVCGCGTPDTDKDGDGAADCIDDCINDPGKTAPGVCGCGTADTDRDADGTPDCIDQCPDDPKKTQPGVCGCGVPDDGPGGDRDGDGTPDCSDGCPDDPAKIDPGRCGCGAADTDRDGDGTPDCNDQCPDDPRKTQPGVCGCGTADTDRDGDDAPDCIDQCPDDPDKVEAGEDGCDQSKPGCGCDTTGGCGLWPLLLLLALGRARPGRKGS